MERWPAPAKVAALSQEPVAPAGPARVVPRSGVLGILSRGGYIRPHPGLEVFEIAVPVFEQTDQELVCGLGLDLDAPPIQAKKHIGRKEGDPLVAIDEGMIHEQ